MKKILSLLFLGTLLITLTGCEENKKNQDNKEEQEVLEKEPEKVYESYNFGEVITVKVNDTETIKGYVLEDKNEKIVLLEENSSRQSTYDNVENVISELKSSWTNADDVNLLSLDVLFNNLTLTDNSDKSGYSGIRDEEGHFLYSENPYWLSSNDYKDANCYEADNRCNWATYDPYISLVDNDLNLYVRLSFEISKDYIEG